MKNLFVIFIVLFLTGQAYASSINTAAYKTMQAQSYRNNYQRQVNNNVMPYWQAQSNYTTRNRFYRDYPNSARNYSGYYRGYR